MTSRSLTSTVRLCPVGTDTLSDLERQVLPLPNLAILRRRHVTSTVGTGFRTSEQVAEARHDRGRTWLIHAMRAQPAGVLDRVELHRDIGTENPASTVEPVLGQLGALPPWDCGVVTAVA